MAARFRTQNINHVTRIDDIRRVLAFAHAHHQTVVPRGTVSNTISATPDPQQVIIDFSRMKRWEWVDRQQGIIRAGPGVTIGDLCRATLVEGWWPAVHPLIEEATIGGSLSLNAHGISTWGRGTIGHYVRNFQLLLASGDLLTISSSNRRDELFYSVIGGLGMLGIIASITLKLQRIHSAVLQTYLLRVSSLLQMFRTFHEQSSDADYLVGWIDGYARGASLGRGVVISGALPRRRNTASLRSTAREWSTTSTGTIKAGFQKWVSRHFLNTPAVRIANARMYYRHRNIQSASIPTFHFRFQPWYYPSHARKGYHFLQAFVPTEYAKDVFQELLERSQQARFIPFWCCMRRHQADQFVLSYLIDGFSLELVYYVAPGKEARFSRLLAEMRRSVFDAGGRFSAIRDDMPDAQSFRESMGVVTLAEFQRIKNKYDPETLFQYHLYHHLFG